LAVDRSRSRNTELAWTAAALTLGNSSPLTVDNLQSGRVCKDRQTFARRRIVKPYARSDLTVKGASRAAAVVYLNMV